MQYRDSADISGAQVIRSGGGGGGKFVVGGGAGLIVMVLALLFGFNPGDILGSASGTTTTSTGGSQVECRTGADVAANRDCRWNAYVTSIENYWSSTLTGYRQAPLVVFTDSVTTGCGRASSQVGPFYCPADGRAYIDTGFTEQLLKQLGARGGDAAEAYIIAHEYGHHIQNLTGTMAKVQSAGRQTGPTSGQVRLELQADCYAGVWFRNSTSDPNGPIKSVTQDDLDRVVDAAIAVGDDRIQESSTGGVDPESWTHGSSAQRKAWMARGFQSGDPNRCDTFSTDDLLG